MKCDATKLAAIFIQKKKLAAIFLVLQGIYNVKQISHIKTSKYLQQFFFITKVTFKSIYVASWKRKIIPSFLNLK